MIRLYHRMPLTRALGPGDRYAIWVQGCPFHCKGCVAPDTLSFDGGQLVPIYDVVSDIISQPNIEGVTVSGGEPFEQSSALFTLLSEVKKYRDVGIIVYSGYRYEDLLKKAHHDIVISDLLGEIDLLIDGLYLENKNDGFPMKGSSNQRFICLTERYTSFIGELSTHPYRSVEFHLNTDDVMLVGVPSNTQLHQWNRFKNTGN